MDISEFKIALHKELFVIYLKYPIIKNRCDTYYARAISHNDGKLVLSNQVAKCDNTYYEINYFKRQLFNNVLSKEKSCFTSLLNGEKSICNKIREKNKQIDIIQEGAILVNGNNIVNDSCLIG